MRPLIEQGYIYATTPPLYKIITKKETLYVKDDSELKEYKKKHPNIQIKVQRFKGLTHCSGPYFFILLINKGRLINLLTERA